MADSSKMPTIGNRTKATSYPNPDHGRDGEMNDSGLGPANLNASNFPADPPVFNASPATKKSYSWNKGETGNAT
jgi:hypothetical protein